MLIIHKDEGESMKNVACFDIGGTFIKYGVVTENGNVIYKDKFQTPKPDCKNTIPIALVSKLKELNRICTVDCIGISTAGQVDSAKGEIVFASENLPGYTGAKLSEVIQNLTGLVCHVENDVNSAALGELWQGDIGNSNSFFFLTLGTGIGGAIIIDKKLYKGTKGGAGEIGHMVINENGNKCACGGTGCYENYASVSALIRNYCSASGTLNDKINGEKLIELVKLGDKVACDIYDKFVYHIVTGLINVTHMFDPGLIIIGGGISEQNSLITDINANFKKRAMSSYTNYTKIISSSLRNDAGLMGACYVGLNKTF